MDDVEKKKFLTLPGLELPPLGRPTRSQSLYRLRNPTEYKMNLKFLMKIFTKKFNLWLGST
jgi:hypothetical protein